MMRPCLFAAAIFSLFAGSPASADPPFIALFEVDRTVVLAGGDVTISWAVGRTDLITIEPGGFSTTESQGSTVVQPTETTTYVFSAINSEATRERRVTIEVLPFVIESFTATPHTVEEVQDILLEWEVTGTASVSIDGLGPQPQVGSAIVRPQVTTVYVLHAAHEEIERTETARVRVVIPETSTLQLSWSGTEFPGPPPSLRPFVPFDLWVLAVDPIGGFDAYSYALELLPEGCWTVVEEEIFPEGSTDFGIDSSSILNYIVGTGGTCREEGFIVPVLRLRLLTTQIDCLLEGTASLGPAIPGYFPDHPDYLPCICGICHPRVFGIGPDIHFGEWTDPTPAIVLDATAQGTLEGVRVEWDIAHGSTVDRLQVVRRSSSNARVAEILADWTGDVARIRGEYVDASGLPGVLYSYHVRALAGGSWIESDPIEAARGDGAPGVTRLLRAAPNPFNPRTEIHFSLSSSASPVLEFYDGSGRRVRRVPLSIHDSGLHRWSWDGTDDSGAALSSGVYFIRLLVGAETDGMSAVLLR